MNSKLSACPTRSLDLNDQFCHRLEKEINEPIPKQVHVKIRDLLLSCVDGTYFAYYNTGKASIRLLGSNALNDRESMLPIGRR